jgi:hypothetical protein
MIVREKEIYIIDIYSFRAPVSWLTTVSLILEILVVKDYFIPVDDLAIVS